MEKMPNGSTELLTLSHDLSMIYHEIYNAKRMVFLTGAGISCSAGIPDFRSSNGLYNMTEGLSGSLKGKDLFDISLFQSSETIKCFSIFMANLYSSTLEAKPTTTHKFINSQIEKNKVIRCYTQNIDGLEERLGLNMKFENEGCNTLLQKWKSMDVVQLHGDLNELACTSCSKVTGWTDLYKGKLSTGELPECSRCVEAINARVEQGKRMTGTVGVLRPNVVLYGENHPFSDIISTGLNSDLKQRPDMFIIMGTSLKVHGVKQLVKSMSKVVHSKGGKVILINKDTLTGWNGYIDFQVQADCDSFVKQYQDFEQQVHNKKIPSTPTKTRIKYILNTPSPKKLSTPQLHRILQTPKSTPRRKRASIRKLINTPSPRKKQRVSVYQDCYPSPEEQPSKKSPRKTLLKELNSELNTTEDEAKKLLNPQNLKLQEHDETTDNFF